MLQERQYVVKITALLDRSTAAAAGDLVQTYDRAARAAGRRMSEEERASKRAAAERERNERYVANVKGRYFREEQRRQETADRKAEREAQQRARREEAAAERTARAKERAEEKAAEAKARAEERAQRHVQRIRERSFAEQQRQTTRDENDRRQRIAQIAGDSIGNMTAAGRKALGVAGQIAGGLGVDFSMQRGVAKGVELEKMAVAIVNAGNRGKGSAEERDLDVLRLQESAREIGNRYAFDPTQVLGGLAKYQALTGDLDTAKAGLSDLAKLASAFNTDLDQMVAAAGQVGSAIGEVGEGKAFATSAEKAAAVLDVLKSLTAQGQEGAIEVSDVAVQMAKLKAAGAAFEGSTAENIKKVGAMAQLSLQLGGSASATQAATSVMGFVSTLKTPARRKEFAAAGVDIDSATEKGAFADPFEIIKRSLAATQGDPEKMKKLFANVVGERAVTALTNTYNKAGGGKAGMDAVNDQLARFSGSVSDKVIEENSARRLRSKEGKAQIQQNKIDERWAAMSERVLNNMEKLGPTADKVVSAFASLVEFVGNNLGTSIALAITGSIGKAVIGPMLKEALINSLTTKGIGGTAGAIAGMPGAGAALAGVTIMATAAYLTVKEFNANKDQAGKDEQERLANAQKLLDDAAQSKEPLTKDKLNEIARARAELEGSRGLAKRYRENEDLNWFEKFGGGVYDFFAGENASKGKAELEGRGKEAAANVDKIDALAAKMDALIKATTDNKQRGPIDVNVVGGTVAVNGGGAPGRVGVPDQGG